MAYYIFVKDNKLNGCGEVKVISEGFDNIPVTQEFYNDFVENTSKYIFSDGEIVLNPNYEAELAQKEAERIAMLNLTAADVERGIYKAKCMDFDDIISLVQRYPQEGLDVKALKIELKANNFYRGNPYVNAVGALLGFTPEQLDKFFEDGNYQHLLEV